MNPNIRKDGSIFPKFKCRENAFVINSKGKIEKKKIATVCCDGENIWYCFEDGTRLFEELCYKSENYAMHILNSKKEG